MSSLFGNFYANIWVIDCVTKYLGAFLTVRTAYEKILPLRGRIFDRFIIRKSKCSTDFKRNDFLKKTKRTHWVRFVHLNSLIESCVFLYLWNSPFDTFL